MFDSIRLGKRLTDVEERLSTAERRLNAMSLEWTDNLERMKRMMGRIAKDRSRVEQIEPSGDYQGHLSDEEVSNGAVTLSQRPLQANARILVRRNGSQ